MRTSASLRATCVSLLAGMCLASSATPIIATRPTLIHRLETVSTVVKLRGGSSRNIPSKNRAKKTSATAVSSPSSKTLTPESPHYNAARVVCGLIMMIMSASVIFEINILESIASALTTTKARLLVLMVFQNAFTVLVGRYTRSTKSSKDLYVINHLVLMCEVVKFILSCILEYRATDGHLLASVQENIIDRPMTSVKIVIPSLLYLVQNSLQYVALSNLSAPLFQVTYQAKLLTTALASVLLLQRKYSVKQWVCLTTLGIGVAIVVLGESMAQTRNKAVVKPKKSSVKKATRDDKPKQNLVVGLSAVTVACISSALASVYLEKVLKKPAADGSSSKPVSLWIFNMQMAFFSACIAAVQTKNLTGADAEKPFLHGFTPWVWALVILQAGGGLLVAAVMKYADNVLKGLATGVSVVVSTSLSMTLFDTPLTKEFTVGAGIILASVYLFSN